MISTRPPPKTVDVATQTTEVAGPSTPKSTGPSGVPGSGGKSRKGSKNPPAKNAGKRPRSSLTEEDQAASTKKRLFTEVVASGPSQNVEPQPPGGGSVVPPMEASDPGTGAADPLYEVVRSKKKRKGKKVNPLPQTGDPPKQAPPASMPVGEPDKGTPRPPPTRNQGTPKAKSVDATNQARKGTPRLGLSPRRP